MQQQWWLEACALFLPKLSAGQRHSREAWVGELVLCWRPDAAAAGSRVERVAVVVGCGWPAQRAFSQLSGACGGLQDRGSHSTSSVLQQPHGSAAHGSSPQACVGCLLL